MVGPGRLPPDLHSDPVGEGERFAGRGISIIETIQRQLDRIAYLRSVGAPWAEALYALRDMLVGREDQQFWDGLPGKVRERVTELEGGDKKARNQAKRLRDQYWPDGWLGCPVRAFRGPRGPIYKPTPENLSHQFRIVMALMNRHRLLWKTRGLSSLPDLPGSEDEAGLEA